MVTESPPASRYVFISFATENRDLADRTLAKLEAGGIRCWIAHRDIAPADSYARAIGPAIEASGALLLFFSEASNGSPHVLTEVEIAFNRRMPILPIRIEDVVPSTELKYFLSRAQWLDTGASFDDEDITRVEARVRELLSGEAVPYEPPPPPVVVPPIYSSTVFRMAVSTLFAASLIVTLSPFVRYVVPLSYGLTLVTGMVAVGVTRQYNALALFTIGFVQLLLVFVPAAMDNPSDFLVPLPSLLGGLVCAFGGLVIALPLRAVNARSLSFQDWRAWLAAPFRGSAGRRGRG